MGPADGNDAVEYNPWSDVGARPEIEVDTTTMELPAGDAWWLPEVLGIVLDRRLSRIERRCALAHELAHVDHDDIQVCDVGPDGPRLARRQETRADRVAARRLIDMQHLAAALAAHPDDAHAVAEALDVTETVLRVRLEHLHPSELGVVRAALAAAGHAA